jgi:hypothetical protein
MYDDQSEDVTTQLLMPPGFLFPVNSSWYIVRGGETMALLNLGLGVALGFKKVRLDSKVGTVNP